MCCEIVCHKGALLTFLQLIAQNVSLHHVEIKNVISVQNTGAKITYLCALYTCNSWGWYEWMSYLEHFWW
jgi:hypothetical protein